MAGRTPKSLTRYCRDTMTALLDQTDGSRMLAAAREIVETDKWNSFDRFHQTTATLVRGFEQAGAAVEVEAIQTGGRSGTGRWVIHEAADINSARVDVVAPVKHHFFL